MPSSPPMAAAARAAPACRRSASFAAAVVVAALFAGVGGVEDGAEVCRSAEGCGDAAGDDLPAVVPGEAPFGYPRYAKVPRELGARVWSPEQLALHDGSRKDLPLLLAIVGEVYDVGTGSQHYGPEQGYTLFAGSDTSRGFADMEEVEELKGSDKLSKIKDLADDGFGSVLGWRTFYRDHETYRFVGYLEGRYYNASGHPTSETRRVEARHAKLVSAEQSRAKLQERFMACNSRHSTNDAHFDIWCDDSYHPPGSLPVHLYFKNPTTEEESGWCACLPPRQRKRAEADSVAGGMRFRLVDYSECSHGKQRCQRPKGAPPP